MRVALLALSLLLPCLAHAALYECRDANGRRTFSDTPCSPDAKVLDVAPTAPGAPGASAGPGSLGTARIEYYDVSGATLDQLRSQMSARGTDGWAGHTHTHVAYHFTTQPTGGGCRVDEVTVTLDAVVRLPRWTDRDAAPAGAQGEWDRLMTRLVDHEGGHVRIGQASADAVERAVRETTPGASCPDVAARAKGRADAILALLPQQQEDYDVRTNHGRGP
jgi:predicted secreted Zn-dependent protease